MFVSIIILFPFLFHFLHISIFSILQFDSFVGRTPCWSSKLFTLERIANTVSIFDRLQQRKECSFAEFTSALDLRAVKYGMVSMSFELRVFYLLTIVIILMPLLLFISFLFPIINTCSLLFFKLQFKNNLIYRNITYVKVTIIIITSHEMSTLYGFLCSNE